jgi:hypothetical protein
MNVSSQHHNPTVLLPGGGLTLYWAQSCSENCGGESLVSAGVRAEDCRHSSLVSVPTAQGAISEFSEGEKCRLEAGTP